MSKQELLDWIIENSKAIKIDIVDKSFRDKALEALKPAIDKFLKEKILKCEDTTAFSEENSCIYI